MHASMCMHVSSRGMTMQVCGYFSCVHLSKTAEKRAMQRIATNLLAANGSQIPEAVAELQLAIAARSPVKLSARSALLPQSYLFPQARLDLLQHVSCAVPVSRSGRHSDLVQKPLALWSLDIVTIRI